MMGFSGFGGDARGSEVKEQVCVCGGACASVRMRLCIKREREVRGRVTGVCVLFVSVSFPSPLAWPAKKHSGVSCRFCEHLQGDVWVTLWDYEKRVLLCVAVARCSSGWLDGSAGTDQSVDTVNTVLIPKPPLLHIGSGA
jgi:hypothetical protein